MEAEHNHKIVGTNPVVAIGFAIGVAGLMVLTTFLIFINSDSYKTVKQIEAGTKVARALQSSNGEYDTRSPIKADDISVYQNSVEQRLKALDDTNDFGPENVSNAGLGLTF